MTPAARLQATIELLETILETDKPADAVLAHYFKGRRFFGSKDRRPSAKADNFFRNRRGDPTGKHR